MSTFSEASLRPSSNNCLLNLNALSPGCFYSTNGIICCEQTMMFNLHQLMLKILKTGVTFSKNPDGS